MASVGNVSTKDTTIVKRVTVGKPVRRIRTATVSVVNLTDVDVSNLSDGQVLQYDASTQKWVSQDQTIALSGVTGIDTSGAVEGSTLVYDEESGEFQATLELENQNINGGQY